MAFSLMDSPLWDNYVHGRLARISYPVVNLPPRPRSAWHGAGVLEKTISQDNLLQFVLGRFAGVHSRWNERWVPGVWSPFLCTHCTTTAPSPIRARYRLPTPPPFFSDIPTVNFVSRFKGWVWGRDFTSVVVKSPCSMWVTRAADQFYTASQSPWCLRCRRMGMGNRCRGLLGLLCLGSLL